MTYPQSGPSYGQGDPGQGQQYGSGQYGQAPQYGQENYGAGQYGQAPQPQYGQEQYGQEQYGSGQYGQGHQYGQGQYGSGQYGSGQYGGQPQQQYGGQQQYAAPKPPSQGLPHNTVQILAAAVGALGVIMLFLGFLPGYKAESFRGESQTVKVFETHYATAWGLFAVAGVAALLTFLVGAGKQYVAAVASLSVVAALITIFQFATADVGPAASNGTGGILLLVFTIIGAIVAIAWLLVEVEVVKTAPAPAGVTSGAHAAPAQSAAAPGASAPATGPSSAATPAAGYGQSSSGSSASAYGAPAPAYGDASASTYGSGAAPSLGDASASSYGTGAATYGQSAAGEADATSYNPLPGSSPAGDGSETTIFGTPETPENPTKDS